MYMQLLSICILLVFLFLMLLFTKTETEKEKEGFDNNLGRLIPIDLSGNQIKVPNTINSHNNQELQFVGNITMSDLNLTDLNVNDHSTINRLLVDTNTTFNTVTLNQPIKLNNSQLVEFGSGVTKSNPENGTIGYKTGLDGNALNIVGADKDGVRNVHVWDEVEIQGDLIVNGTLKFGPTGGNTWSLTTRNDGNIDFLHKDTSRDDYAPNTGHMVLSKDGNVWLSNSNYAGWGWIADNLQGINQHRDDVINAERERRREEEARREEQERRRQQTLLEQAQQMLSRTMNRGGGCVIS
jgi:hypothetical protein